jgi:hypothetical protein
LVVVGLFLLESAINTWWLGRFRIGYPLDIDEAGYMTAAYDDSTALLQHGLTGLAHAYLTPSQFGPLVPLLTVPAHLTLGRDIFSGLYIELPFLLALLCVSYLLGERLGGPLAGVLTTIAVAGMPAVIDFSRSYQFVLATTTVFVGAVYALVKSEGGRRRGWSIAWGVLLGAAVLARLMVIAFVPGFIAAAAIQAAAAQDLRRRRALNTLVGLLVAGAVGATWYAKNGGVALHYLVLYGYGAKAADYGPALNPLSIGFWTRRVTDSIDQYLYLPLALILVACLLGTSRQWIRRQPSFTRMLGTGAAAVGVIAIAGYLALTSTSNQGTGFGVPIMPLLLALGAAALVHLQSPRTRTALAAALVASAAFNLLSKADLTQPASANAAVVGRTVADGRGVIQRYLVAARYPQADLTRAPADQQRQWLPAAHDLARRIEEHASARGLEPIVCFASRDPLFNTNTLVLEARFADQRRVPVTQMDSRLEGDNVAAYRHALVDPSRGQPNYLVTADPAPNEFRGKVTQAYAETAARDLGFVEVESMLLPDGRETRLWWRGVPLPAA